MKKNVASQVIGAQMVTAADGSAFTGTVAVAVTVDGGTQGAGGGTGPTHEGNGFHTYLPTQAETNGDHVAFTFTGTGAIPVTVQVYTSFPQTGDAFARLGAPAGASVSADVAAVKAETAAIVVDTGTTIPAQISGLENLSAAEVNAEVVDALNVDTYAEPGQGAPAATAPITTKIGWVYKMLRNKLDQTATTFRLYADDGTTVDSKATVSSDGTTTTRGEIVSGP